MVLSEPSFACGQVQPVWETIRETSSHATRQETLTHSRLSSLSHCGLFLSLKSWCTQAPHEKRRKKEGAGGKRFVEFPTKLCYARKANNTKCNQSNFIKEKKYINVSERAVFCTLKGRRVLLCTTTFGANPLLSAVTFNQIICMQSRSFK